MENFVNARPLSKEQEVNRVINKIWDKVKTPTFEERENILDEECSKYSALVISIREKLEEILAIQKESGVVSPA